MAYLSELKIQEATVVRKVRRLPLPGTILVKPGDAVTAQQEVARTDLLPGEPSIVQVAKQLKCPPEEAEQYLTVSVGDQVKRQQVIARRPGFAGGDAIAVSTCDGVVEFVSSAYGQVLIREAGDPVHSEVRLDMTKSLGVVALFSAIEMRVKVGDDVRLGQVVGLVEGNTGRQLITSPCTGTITSIDLKHGDVRIRKAYKPAIVDAYIPGQVVEVHQKESVTIETPAAFVQGIFGLGGEHHGELALAVAGPDAELKPELITEAARGKVLIGGAYVSLPALQKALAVGAVGIITGGARASDLSTLAGRNIGIGVTGSEDAQLTVVLTEGFGRMRMADRTFALLKSHVGESCSLSGASQIRAGVIRPEVIIPLAAVPAPAATVAAAALSLRLGAQVRIIRAPYFGLWGHITGLPGEAVARPTGARLPVVEVELDDGRRVEVLETNIELFRAM